MVLGWHAQVQRQGIESEQECRSAGCGGGYVLAGAESCRKVAVAARVMMLGGGVIVVRVEGFGV